MCIIYVCIYIYICVFAHLVLLGVRVERKEYIGQLQCKWTFAVFPYLTPMRTGSKLLVFFTTILSA